jgi:hypothetical protein
MVVTSYISSARQAHTRKDGDQRYLVNKNLSNRLVCPLGHILRENWKIAWVGVPDVNRLGSE